jgi:DNA-binding PucR family transcriptional regulator
VAAVTSEDPGGLVQAVKDKVYALLPGPPDPARRVAGRLGRHATVGLSSYRSGAAEAHRALEEAELVLGLTAAGAAPPGAEIGSGTYRLLFRVMASHPQEVRSFFDDTVAPLVAYDEQYETELVRTLETFLDADGNVAGAAERLFTHRHTVRYRLERVKELTELDVSSTDGRERLSLGLKARRVLGIVPPGGPAQEKGAEAGRVPKERKDR